MKKGLLLLGIMIWSCSVYAHQKGATASEIKTTASVSEKAKLMEYKRLLNMPFSELMDIAYTDHYVEYKRLLDMPFKDLMAIAYVDKVKECERLLNIPFEELMQMASMSLSKKECQKDTTVKALANSL